MRNETFTFRDHYPGEPGNYMDRQLHNQILRKDGLPITVGCLDVLISLRTLPPGERSFTGILDDMVTLIPPEGMRRRFPRDTEPFRQKELELILKYLIRKKMIKKEKKESVETFFITEKGKEMMKKARQAFGHEYKLTPLPEEGKDLKRERGKLTRNRLLAKMVGLLKD